MNSPSAMRLVLVTGASGFVGAAVVRRLLAGGFAVRCATRSPLGIPGVESVGGCDLGQAEGWGDAVRGVDCVIHAAARVHVMHDTAADPLAEFRRVNLEGTLRLARLAAQAGVRRFVFISSIKVNGEGTLPGLPYTAQSVPAPVDNYGRSKLEAERALFDLGRSSGMHVVVVRPPLVYGPGVKGNFLSMLRWLDKGVPLPLGRVDNRRSFVAVDNLADLIVTTVSHPAAAGRVFLASDGEDLSTTELLVRIGRHLGRPPRLLGVPVGAMATVAGLLGKRGVAQRLFGSLQVDTSATRTMLQWSPPVEVDDALARTVAHFRSRVAEESR